mmetsp:Transcript_19612/g.45736  ORF Transcript_19612/g.45736 Transcript_19612/m.45736 type:complete len:150 (+) Transcript_19612:1763-2212(+)
MPLQPQSRQNRTKNQEMENCDANVHRIVFTHPSKRRIIWTIDTLQPNLEQNHRVVTQPKIGGRERNKTNHHLRSKGSLFLCEPAVRRRFAANCFLRATTHFVLHVPHNDKGRIDASSRASTTTPQPKAAARARKRLGTDVPVRVAPCAR